LSKSKSFNIYLLHYAIACIELVEVRHKVPR